VRGKVPIRLRLDAGLVALAAIASYSCASGRAGWTAGSPEDASLDATIPEASPEAMSSGDCGPVAPRGTQLVSSPSVAIDGVTSDGYAIYTDVAAMTVNAVPIVGGSPRRLGTVDASNAVFINGDVVYFEPAVVPGGAPGLSIASLSVWKAATGTAIVSTSILAAPASSAGSGNGFVDVSADGSRIVYIETQDGLNGTLTVATTDGAARVPLVAGLDMTPSGCRPFVAFVGSNAVAAYCLEAGFDGGSPVTGPPEGGAVVDAAAPPDGSTLVDASTPPDGSMQVDASSLPDASRLDAAPLDAALDSALDSAPPPDAAPRPDASNGPDARALDGAAIPDAATMVDAAADGFPPTMDASPSPDAGSSRDASPRDGAIAEAAPPDSGRLLRGAGNGDPLAPANAPDGAVPLPLATVATFTGPAFVQHVLASRAQPAFALDVAGSHVLVAGPSGLAVYPIEGGAAVPIDSEGTGGALTRDGATVIYTTSAQALKRSPIVRPAPVTLVPSGVSGLYGLSPDERWVLTYRTQAEGGETSDLYLASAITADAARALSVSTSAAIFGAAFTADSQYALYFDDVSVASGVGDFVVASVSGGPPTKVTSDAFVAAATAGSQVLVTDNCTTCTAVSAGAADLRAFDAVNPATITTLVSQAYASFYLDAARDKVVYSWTCKRDGTAGVYVLPVP
jgi:hypothetical protein